MALNASRSWSQFPGLPFAFPFEANFDALYHRNWFEENWTISFLFSAIYVTAVHLGVRFMATRKPLNLRTPLMLWSAALAVFSVYGSLRILPETLKTFREGGFTAVCCDRSFTKDVRFEFAVWIFVWSKVLELMDTFFIVARKQKLIFLHWFHHFLTLTYGFYGFAAMPSVYRPFASMNYSVHSMMYFYYALRAARVHIPKPIAVFITSSQIVQMIVGLLVCVTSLAVKKSGGNCGSSYNQLYFGLAVYGSFFVLFGNFFLRTYLLPSCARESLPFNGNNNHRKAKEN